MSGDPTKKQSSEQTVAVSKFAPTGRTSDDRHVAWIPPERPGEACRALRRTINV